MALNTPEDYEFVNPRNRFNFNTLEGRINFRGESQVFHKRSAAGRHSIRAEDILYLQEAIRERLYFERGNAIYAATRAMYLEAGESIAPIINDYEFLSLGQSLKIRDAIRRIFDRPKFDESSAFPSGFVLDTEKANERFPVGQVVKFANKAAAMAALADCCQEESTLKNYNPKRELTVEEMKKYFNEVARAKVILSDVTDKLTTVDAVNYDSAGANLRYERGIVYNVGETIDVLQVSKPNMSVRAASGRGLFDSAATVDPTSRSRMYDGIDRHETNLWLVGSAWGVGCNNARVGNYDSNKYSIVRLARKYSGNNILDANSVQWMFEPFLKSYGFPNRDPFDCIDAYASVQTEVSPGTGANFNLAIGIIGREVGPDYFRAKPSRIALSEEVT